MDDILEIRDLKVWFPVRRGVFARTVGHVKAVDGVTFSVRRGETLGIVGESGSGKSTIAGAITGLVRPTGGDIVLRGKVAMVFQDPLGSLNPRMTVAAAIGEVLSKEGLPRSREDIAALLESVGIAEDALDRYPHEFSGGQRQRICIARAIATNPELLICDEAVSALDLSIRSQILDLLSDLKRRLGLSMLFITHDLGVVQHIADRTIVMHNGHLEAEDSEYATYLRAAVCRIPR